MANNSRSDTSYHREITACLFIRFVWLFLLFFYNVAKCIVNVASVSGSVPNTRHVSCLDTAAGVNDESCQAVATDDKDDVTLDEMLHDCNQNCKLSTKPMSPSKTEELTGSGMQATRGDVTDSGADESDKEENTEEAAEIETADQQPPERGKYRDEELVQCGTCKGMFLRRSIFDHVALCKKNTAEPFNRGCDIFQCKLCDYSGIWYRAHSKQHIAGKLYKCSVCSYASNTPKHVRRHCREVQPCSTKNASLEVTRTAVECCNCKKVFSTEALYRSHYMEQHVIMLKQFEWCGDCQAWFKVGTNAAHRKLMHSKTFICDVCGKEFQRAQELKRHGLVHSAPTKSCHQCGKKFKQKTSLQRHLLYVHETVDRKHYCSQCGKFYKTPVSLKLHIDNYHSLPVEFACEVCGKCFRTAATRNTHMLTHSDDRPFKCSKCSKCFKTSTALSNHMLSHSDERKFNCNLCDWSFKQKSHLTYHMRSHSDVRAFQCTVCERSFKSRPALRDHVFSHTGERPFACSHCQKDFVRKVDLNKHLHEVHSNL